MTYVPDDAGAPSSAGASDTGTNVPGFGAVVAVVAVFVVALSARLRG